jgi:hypothetical protein
MRASAGGLFNNNEEPMTHLLSKTLFMTTGLPLMAVVRVGAMIAVSSARLGLRDRGTAASRGQGNDDSRGLYL